MTKTLKQKIDSNDVIGLFENLKENEIKKGVHYSDSGFRGKNKDGLWRTNENPQTVADYVKEHYPISLGKHEVKYNSKKDRHNHKINLRNKYGCCLNIEFQD